MIQTAEYCLECISCLLAKKCENERSHAFRGFRGRRVITRRCYEDKKHTPTSTLHDSKPKNKNYTKSSLKRCKPYKVKSNSFERDLLKHEVIEDHSKSPTCLQCDVRLKNLTFGPKAKRNQIKRWILHVLDVLLFNVASNTPLFMNGTSIYNIRARKWNTQKLGQREFTKLWVWRDWEEEEELTFASLELALGFDCKKNVEREIKISPFSHHFRT